METVDKAEAALPPNDDESRSERIVMVTASTDPNRALADIAQQREADRRRGTTKRAAQAVFVLGVLAAALLVPRFREHGRAAAPVSDPAAVAPRAKSTPATTASLPLAPADGEQATQAPVATPQDPPAQCESHFKARQWRGAIESCSIAFEMTPTATLAMRVAHAHWAHGDAAGAGTWAQQALELESTDPDAHVLIGNAEHAAGKRRKAVAAYRRYLELAPRGWHAERLRAYMQGAAAGKAQ